MANQDSGLILPVAGTCAIAVLLYFVFGRKSAKRIVSKVDLDNQSVILDGMTFFQVLVMISLFFEFCASSDATAHALPNCFHAHQTHLCFASCLWTQSHSVDRFDFRAERI